VDSGAEALRGRRGERDAAPDHRAKTCARPTRSSGILPPRCPAAKWAASASTPCVSAADWITSRRCRRRSFPDPRRRTRDAIRKLPAGSYKGETSFDVPGGEVIRLCTEVTIDRRARGRSALILPAAPAPAGSAINVVPAYTHAYSSFCGSQHPESGPGQQCREPGADQDQAAQQLHRQR